MIVIVAPDPRLRVQTKAVKKITPALLQTLKEMIKLTQTFKDPEGVGLASTQIGLDESFFVAKINNTDEQTGQLRAFINPKILSLGKKTKIYFEGCLSIPKYFGDTQRSTIAKVSYQDQTGQTHTETLKGVNAWIFQHEMDHLSGVLFVDRVLQQNGKMYKFTGKDKTGTDIFEEMTI